MQNILSPCLCDQLPFLSRDTYLQGTPWKEKSEKDQISEVTRDQLALSYSHSSSIDRSLDKVNASIHSTDTEVCVFNLFLYMKMFVFVVSQKIKSWFVHRDFKHSISDRALSSHIYTKLHLNTPLNAHLSLYSVTYKLIIVRENFNKV